MDSGGPRSRQLTRRVELFESQPLAVPSARGAQTPLPPKIPRRQVYKALLGARAVNDGRGEKDEWRDQSGGGREAKESARDRRLGRW